MVQNSENLSPFSLTFNDFILVHQYIHLHSTTTLSFNMYTNSHSILSYEYIHSHLQHIFIHIQAQIFIQQCCYIHSTFCWCAKFHILSHRTIYNSFSRIYLFIYTTYIHSHSRSKVLFNTVAIFIQHFVCIPLYASLDPKLLSALFSGNTDTKHRFLVSMDITSLYTPGDTQRLVSPSRSPTLTLS